MRRREPADPDRPSGELTARERRRVSALLAGYPDAEAVAELDALSGGHVFRLWELDTPVAYSPLHAIEFILEEIDLVRRGGRALPGVRHQP